MQKNLVIGFSLLLIIFTVAPFVMAGLHAFPNSDDFWHSDFVKRFGFWETQSRFYHNWTGRFGSTLTLCIFDPLIYNSYLPFSLYPTLLILVFITGICLLSKKIFADMIPVEYCYLISALFIFLFFYAMPGVSDGLYWYTSYVVYFLPLSLTAYWVIWVLRIRDAASMTWQSFAAGLMAAWLVSSNELQLLITNGFLAILFLQEWMRNKKVNKSLLLVFVIVLFASVAAIAAPGNFVRQTYSPDAKQTGVLYAFYSAFALGTGTHLKDYLLTTPVFLVLMVLLIIGWRYGKQYKSVFPFWLHLVFAAALFYATFLPGSYAKQGNYTRTLNVSYYVFLCAGFYAAIMVGVITKGFFAAKLSTLQQLAWPVLITVTLAFVFIKPNHILQAWNDVKGKDIIEYDHQMSARFHQLEQKRNSNADIVLPAITARPVTLFYQEINADEQDLTLSKYAYYYGINKICVPPSSFNTDTICSKKAEF